MILDGQQLIHGDCLEVMKDFPDNYIDLTVTSPPYDNLRTYNDSLEWGEHIWKPAIEQLFRITKDGGVIVWIVNDATINGSETGTSFKQALYFKEIGFNLHDTMIYKKNGIQYPDTNRYYNAFEYMFVLSKGKPKTFNLLSDRGNKRPCMKVSGNERKENGDIRKKNISDKVIKLYGVRFNIWEYNTGKSKTNEPEFNNFTHPAMFPIQLASDHIKSWSNENDLILDPFAGSFTTGVACNKLNRKFIGIEKELEYYNIGCERMKANRNLFLEAK